MEYVDKNSSKVRYEIMEKLKGEFYDTIMVVARPAEDQVCPSVVASMLGEFDRSVSTNHHWLPEDPSSDTKTVWGGAVAQFSSREVADRTGKRIFRKMNSLNVMSLNMWVSMLIIAEEGFPKPRNDFTELFIKAKGRVDKDSKSSFERHMKKFGKCLAFFMHNITYRGRDCGLAGVILYPTQCQAYAASLYLNGRRFPKFGYLNVMVRVNRKDNYFDEMVREAFTELSINKHSYV